MSQIDLRPETVRSDYELRKYMMQKIARKYDDDEAYRTGAAIRSAINDPKGAPLRWPGEEQAIADAETKTSSAILDYKMMHMLVL
jgi:hypothetical protein